jgi:dTDP-4-amino-4,6-dideoxygalactose transaminase
MPAKIDRIIELGRQYEIPIIEDAAEALGSSYNNKKLGSFGDIGIFSFNGNKIITTSGGGALASENEAWVKKAKFLSTQARDAAPYYQHSEIGYNYRLSNICAGIGRGQLTVLDQRVAQRRSMFNFYKELLSGFEKIEFQPEHELSFSNRWLSCIVLPRESPISPEALRVFLEKDNIESRPLWKPMHLQPIFKNYSVYGGSVSEDLFERGLCLPSGSNLSDPDRERIAVALNSGLKTVSLSKV